MRKFKKVTAIVVASLVALYLLLLIPDSNNNTHITQGNKTPFEWKKDMLWNTIEHQFVSAKRMQPKLLDSTIQQLKNTANTIWSAIQDKPIPDDDVMMGALENNLFDLASFIAAKPDEVNWLINYYNKVRSFIKQRSQHWDFNDQQVKNSIYTLLYGMRAAIEEVLLQTDTLKISPAMLVQQDSSVTPSTKIFGIEVHSGDMLVSRGGAEVSALISRGNDYPGNFSHVALVYVDSNKQAYLLESHIEKGVAISTVAQYENDKKLRFMVLRLNDSLPAIKQDPMLPQKAAKAMYEEALSRHIPYDFKMNFYDSTTMFCSEVASYAYRKKGIQLWQNSSTISSQGVINWLHDFGVENFITQMPSDLEYDPQLSIIAEWRDRETLFKDHIDNAAMDALLEKANAGEKIKYNIWMLPIVRVLKAYCWVQNRFGGIGIIPEGMSATQALKNETFVAMHVAVKEKVTTMANDFIKQKGYKPPYWQLVRFAQTAANK